MKRVLLAGILIALAYPASAFPDFPEGKWWKRPGIVAAIRLTAEQSDEIEKIFVSARIQLIDLRADVEKKQFELNQVLEQEEADRELVGSKVDAVEQARGRLQKARALMIFEMKQVLRRDQWERLLQLERERKERLEERRRLLRERAAEEERRQRQREEGSARPN